MLPFATRRNLSYLPIVMGRRWYFEGVSASPIVVVMVPRTRLFLYGDRIFAMDKVCIEAANRISTRSVRGEVLSVRKC